MASLKLTPGVRSIATLIMLEVGFQLSKGFDQTAGMDRTEWCDYIMERCTAEQLIECIDEFLKDRWMVELDQLVILEIAYQTAVHNHVVIFPPEAPLPTRQMFSDWACNTYKSRSDLIQLIGNPIITSIN